MKPERNVIIGCTGSVATIKLPELIKELQCSLYFQFNLKIVVTEAASNFVDRNLIAPNVAVLGDKDEWVTWNKRGDPIVHIELCRWADIVVIAPLSANSLAKIANGVCDNLLLCIVRAWDITKPLLFCPAMNTQMYNHSITREHIHKLCHWGYQEIPCVTKTLMCGDTGNGAMAEVTDIVAKVVQLLYCVCK